MTRRNPSEKQNARLNMYCKSVKERLGSFCLRSAIKDERRKFKTGLCDGHWI